MHRLLLADEHQLFTEGLHKLLEAEFDVIEIVCDGRAAVDAFQRLRPDLVLLEIGLPLLNGIEATRRIKQVSPDARILFVTTHADRIWVEEAFAAGASGYIPKQAAASELMHAIRTVLSGGHCVCDRIASKFGSPLWKAGRAPGQVLGGRLTPRQREALQLIAEGKSTKAIAAILQISVRTVEFHKKTMMRELGCHSTAELIRYALQNGIAVM